MRDRTGRDRGRDRTGRDRASGDRGSVLALVPAALLVLLVLAAIAVDSASEYLARRELAAAADAAANDAATFGLDEARFRETGEFVLDPARANEAVAAERSRCAAAGSSIAPRSRWRSILTWAP